MTHIKRSQAEWREVFERAHKAAKNGDPKERFCAIENIPVKSFDYARAKLHVKDMFLKRKSWLPKDFKAPSQNGFVTYAPLSEGRIEITAFDKKINISVARNDEEGLRTILRVIKDMNL